MKKSEQLAINAKVLEAMNAFTAKCTEPVTDWKRLRSCSAKVAQVGNYTLLRSYNTLVALIDRETDTLYDFLRLVYGYTSTSAQHIAKFSKDYGAGKWGCTHRLTYKEV